MDRRISRLLFTASAILFWICLCYLGCEWTPERDNPLDSNSKTYIPPNKGSVLVIVHNLSGVSPLSGVIVSLLPAGQTALTGDDGSHLFDGVEEGEYSVRAWKENYVQDSTQITAAIGRIDTVRFTLDALPLFDSLSVTSRHIGHADSSHDTLVSVFAKITDSDGHIPTVGVSYNGVFVGNLTYNFAEGFFSSLFQVSEITSSTILDVIGRPFVLTADDLEGGINVSDPQFVVRFLDRPIAISPRGGNPVYVPRPTLVWTFYSSGFSYLQNVRVFDQSNQLWWDSLSLDPFITQITVTDSLPPNQGSGNPVSYYWTLEIVDVAGNIARSEENSFLVFIP